MNISQVHKEEKENMLFLTEVLEGEVVNRRKDERLARMAGKGLVKGVHEQGLETATKQCNEPSEHTTTRRWSAEAVKQLCQIMVLS